MKKLAAFFSYLMKHYLPDAYLFAILLTFLSGILALILTPSSLIVVIEKWGNGVYGIVAFAMQMILILVTGYVLALTPALQSVLRWIAKKANNSVKATMIVVFFGCIASWLNWGFGLIFAGLLALEITRQVKKVHFPILIAAAYSGFIIWHMGFSGSVPLVIATKGHAQNFLEKASGIVVPASQTIFAVFNLLPAIIITITLPFIFKLIHPDEKDYIVVSDEKLKDLQSGDIHEKLPENPTLAERIDHSIIINMAFGLMGVIYIIYHFAKKGFDLNLNIVIFIFFILGIILHYKPINYIKAVNQAVKGAGGIVLQFPLYGGIMGIMIDTGLGKVIAQWFANISTPQTFYLLQFYAAGLINMFVPSGGGQWAVQGPITIEAAKLLGINPVKSAMMVAWGDQFTNMIQPFWALPILGMVRLSARDIMGYTAITLIWSGIIFSIFALLIGFGVL